MPSFVVDTDEVAVLGGPTSVNVDLDFGPAGARGSRIFAGLGVPSGQSLTPSLFDMYVNYKADDEEYSYLYQYVNQDGVDQWVVLLKIVPDAYSSKPSPTFASGAATVNIPVSYIVNEIGSVTAENFSAQVTFSGSNPVAASVEYGTIQESGSDYVLPITVNAVEYSSGTWSAVSGEKEFSISLTVV